MQRRIIGEGVKLKLKTTAAHEGKRLDQVLAEWMQEALGRPVDG